MTVLLVLAFFAFFIGLDYALSQRRLAREARAQALAQQPALEPAWVAGYQMPESLFYHRGHTWARPLEGDTVLVGLDDFARKLIGPPDHLRLPSRGDWLHQGGRAFAVKLDGKGAELVSPVEGEVVEVNRELAAKPTLTSEDPYGRGWVLKVKAPNLASNLRNLLSGRLARKWMEDSREALELRLMAFSGSVLQDGGEPASDLGHHLPPGDWDRLVNEFFLT
ncbi:MAG TPA: glycine cleavage system protein H [Vicinamibacteria bacterium]|nr:glycine cleavage system protein H [Vicinamibacteria bacterium]